MITPENTGHPGHVDFLLSAGLTLVSIGLNNYNKIAGAVAVTLTIVLTGIRIVQAIKEGRKK